MLALFSEEQYYLGQHYMLALFSEEQYYLGQLYMLALFSEEQYYLGQLYTEYRLKVASGSRDHLGSSFGS